MSVVYLVELDTGLQIRDWTSGAIRWSSPSTLFSSTSVTWGGKGGVFTKVLPAEILHVLGVAEDGEPLDKVASAAAAETTPGAWHYDVATRTLTIRLVDGASSDSRAFLLVVTALEPLALGASLTKIRDGEPVAWDGRVVAMPSIEQALGDDVAEPSTFSLGQLVIANEDGRYDRLLAERLLAGREVRIYRGDDADAYADFGLWLRGLLEQPVAGVDDFRAQIVSLARELDTAAVTDVFSTADYPTMDPAIAGLPIPKIWGTVFGREAYRIASGRWKVASHAVAAISAASLSSGSAVTITSTDLATGEFTVNAIHDAEARLYVDARGQDTDYPGETIRSVAVDAGIAESHIRVTDLNQVDADRPVKLGLWVTASSYREVLDAIATSAFIDWFVTREDVLTARVRKRDAGNLVSNPGLDVDAAGWTAGNGATVTRITSPVFRGAGAGEIVKPAGQPLAHASAPVNFVAGGRYTVTLLAALLSGSTSAFRVSLVDSAGTEYVSDPITLSASTWTRLTTTLKPAAAGLYWSSTTTRFSSTTTTFAAAGGTVRIYPQKDGGDDVTVAIDDVQVVATILLDDDTAAAIASYPQSLTLWRVRVAYRMDGRTEIARFVELSDEPIRQRVKTAESRELLTALVDEADALAVATAILEYYGAARMRFTVELLEQGVLVALGDVGDAALDRAPDFPDDLRLFRVAGFTEQTPGTALPITTLDLEAVYDPIFDVTTVRS